MDWQVEKLQHQWHFYSSLYTRDDQVIEAEFQKVLDAYSEPHRAYHNLDHIINMIQFTAKNNVQVQDDIIFFFATIYHDFIYDTKDKNNEENSASAAFNYLKSINFSESKLNVVYDFIISTKKHIPILNDPDLEIFLDTDLSILGSERKDYISYSEKIRKEYEWVENETYKKGRKEILIHFLKKTKIYFHPIFEDKLNSKAKLNIEWEINSLTD